MTYIYFFYGLSFVILGLVLLIEAQPLRPLRFTSTFTYLGAFGLLHGAHEFVDMFVFIESTPPSLALWLLRNALLMSSFVMLLIFGAENIHPQKPDYPFPLYVTLGAVVLLIVQLGLVRVVYNPPPGDWMQIADTLIRYSMGIPGSLLGGVGLLLQYHRINMMNHRYPTQGLVWAGFALCIYGLVGQMFPVRTVVFPAAVLNTDTFLYWFGFPVQALRGALAMVIAVGIVSMLRGLDAHLQVQLDTALETERALQVAVRELSLLYEAASLLTAHQDLSTLINEVLQRIVRIIEPVKRGLIIVHSPTMLTCTAEATYGYRFGDYSYVAWLNTCLDQCDGCWFSADNACICNIVHPYLSQPHNMNPIDIHRVVMQLKTSQRTVGTLLLETNPDGPYITTLEAPTIVTLSRQLAVAIDNACLLLSLRERESQRAELLQRATAAQEAERKRIARELHDETGQALTALAMGLQGVSHLIERKPDLAAPQVIQLREIASHALGELRHLISDLRPAHLDDLGLVPTLEWYTGEIIKRGDFDITLTVRGQPSRVLPEVETMLFRITQEGLTNIVKHADATHVDVTITFEPTCIQLSVEDNGRGFDLDHIMRATGQAWGLLGMRERANLVSGTLTIDSKPEEGTRLEVTIPTQNGEHS